MWKFRWGRTQWSGTSAPIYSDAEQSRPADSLNQFVDLFCDRLFDLGSERPGEGAADQGVATLVAALVEHAPRRRPRPESARAAWLVPPCAVGVDWRPRPRLARTAQERRDSAFPVLPWRSRRNRR